MDYSQVDTLGVPHTSTISGVQRGPVSTNQIKKRPELAGILNPTPYTLNPTQAAGGGLYRGTSLIRNSHPP